MKWRSVNLGAREPSEVARLQETIVIARTQDIVPDSIFFFRMNRPTVFIGGSRTGLNHVKTQSCIANNIVVARSLHSPRSPVYLDSKMLCLGLVYKWSEEHGLNIDDEQFKVLKWISESLNSLGLNSRPRRDGNDVMIEDKKICSMGQMLRKGLWLNMISILTDFDFDKAELAIIPKHDMRRSMTTVKKELGRAFTFQEIVDALKTMFEKEFQVKVEVMGDLTDSEYQIMEGLTEKYASESWIRTGRWSPVKDYWRPR